MKIKKLLNAVMAAGAIAIFASACGVDTVGTEVTNVVPAVPADVRATQGTLEDGVEVSWEEAHGAEYYIIYKAADTPEEGFRVVKTRVDGISYLDTFAASGRDYYYKVAAGSGNLWSETSKNYAWGFTLKGTPPPPADVTVSKDIIDRIELSWAEVPNATEGYNLYRCEKMYGAYEKLNDEPITDSTSFIDEVEEGVDKIGPDKNYYYKVTAINDKGEGVRSEAKIGLALQKVPVWGTVGLEATSKAAGNAFGDKIRISWEAADYAASYRIYRALQPDGEVSGDYILIAPNVKDLEYIDKNRSTNIIYPSPDCYHYKVEAVSSGGFIDSGEEATGDRDATLASQLSPPEGLEASSGKTDYIELSWSEVEGRTSFYVYRSESADGEYQFHKEVTDAASGGMISYTDASMSPLPNKKDYWYRVSTVQINQGNTAEGDCTEAVKGMAFPTKPAVPTNIQSTENYNAGTLTISWQPADTTNKTYTVSRSDEVDNAYVPVSVKQLGTSFVDELVGQNEGTIYAGVQYYYKIQAHNDGGNSDESAEESAKFTLQVPTNIKLTKTYNWIPTDYRYALSWNYVKGATGYQVELYRNNGELLDTKNITGGDTQSIEPDDWKNRPNNCKVRMRAVNNCDGEHATVYGNWSGLISP